jgi:AsmA protein
MGRALRIVGIAIVVLIVLVLVIPLLIPVNQFRGTIEEKASTTLGRKVDVGNLKLSIFTGSLAADNISVADDPKFSTTSFLAAKSVKVGVELVPLIFSKELNVTDIRIDGPQVTLIRNPAGEWNYSSLGGSAAKSQTKQESTATSTKEASSSKFSVQQLELNNGHIIVGSTSSKKRSTYDNVSVVASNVSLASRFPVTVAAELPGGGKFKLNGTAGPINQDDTDLTPVNAKLTISSLDLAATGFLDPSIGLGGLLDLDATVASANGESETTGDAKLSKALLIAGGSPSSVPVTVKFDTKYNLHKDSGILEPSTLKIGSAEARLSGTYDIPADTIILHIKVDGQSMPAKDLEAFLPALGVHIPRGASLQSGTLSTNLDLAGPSNKIVTTGSVGLYNARLAGFDLGSKLSAVSSLVGVRTGSDLDIEKLTTNLRMAPDGLKADNFNALVPAIGTLVGSGTIDAKNNLDFKMAASVKNAVGDAASTVENTVTGAAGKAIGDLLGTATSAVGARGAKGLSGCKGGTMTIPFLIQGTTSDPKFVPNVGGLAAGLLKSQLGCSANSEAPKSQAQPQQPPNNSNPVEGLFKKKKP